MSTQKSTLKTLFCLTGMLLDEMRIEDGKILLYVRSPRTSIRCPTCQANTSRIQKRVERRMRHGFCNEMPVELLATLRDFRCKTCGIFRETIPGIDRRKTTESFRSLVLPKVRDRSFSAVAKEYGMSASSLMRSARNLMESIPVAWPTDPFVLGIDEHSFAGRDLVITLTDITNHKLLGILMDDRNSSLITWIRNMPKQKRILIKTICTDMHGGYRSVVEKELPGIPLVVDKFHVIQHFNFHLGQLRSLYTEHTHHLPKQLLEKNKEDLNKVERAKLDVIFHRHPAIAEFWRMKEIMRTIYRMKKPEEASRRFDGLLQGLECDPRNRFQEIYRTLKRWRPCILNYFSQGRVTNAYTEGVHTRIKLLKRISYGFRNKLNYIAKMTLAFIPLLSLLEVLKRHLV
jgi:transposase